MQRTYDVRDVWEGAMSGVRAREAQHAAPGVILIGSESSRSCPSADSGPRCATCDRPGPPEARCVLLIHDRSHGLSRSPTIHSTIAVIDCALSSPMRPASSCSSRNLCAECCEEDNSKRGVKRGGVDMQSRAGKGKKSKGPRERGRQGGVLRRVKQRTTRGGRPHV